MILHCSFFISLLQFILTSTIRDTKDLIILGAIIWFIGAVRSGMDEAITENKLQTKGIYAWVRNPMYSGWWISLSGITLMWHNTWMLILPIIDWVIMTVVLINTEEKWLLDLYGDEYAEYRKNLEP